MLQRVRKTIVEALTRNFKDVWEKEELSKDWMTGLL